MRPSERLREMLDRYGIEWWSDDDISGDHTEWKTDYISYTTLDMPDGNLAVKSIRTMTPEQVIRETVRNTVRLRACPFCGGKARVVRMNYPEDQTVWGVCCKSDADGEYSHAHMIENYATPEEAIDAWNGSWEWRTHP